MKIDIGDLVYDIALLVHILPFPCCFYQDTVCFTELALALFASSDLGRTIIFVFSAIKIKAWGFYSIRTAKT